MTNYETARDTLAADLPAITALARKASSKKSDYIGGLRVWLTTFQQGICAGCGLPLAGKTIELAHIVVSTNKRTGYDIAPGGVYAACKACNAYDIGKTSADIVASMARPDLVARSFPTDSALRAMHVGIGTVASIRDGIANK